MFGNAVFCRLLRTPPLGRVHIRVCVAVGGGGVVRSPFTLSVSGGRAKHNTHAGTCWLSTLTRARALRGKASRTQRWRLASKEGMQFEVTLHVHYTGFKTTEGDQ